MRRLTGLQITEHECAQLSPLLAEAAHHVPELWDFSVIVATVAATVTAVGPEPDDLVTLPTWSRQHAVPARTARRWALRGLIPATKNGPRWMVSESVTPPT